MLQILFLDRYIHLSTNLEYKTPPTYYMLGAGFLLRFILQQNDISLCVSDMFNKLPRVSQARYTGNGQESG